MSKKSVCVHVCEGVGSSFYFKAPEKRKQKKKKTFSSARLLCVGVAAVTPSAERREGCSDGPGVLFFVSFNISLAYCFVRCILTVASAKIPARKSGSSFY